MVLTEMKISTAAYCRNWLGYEILCSPDRTASVGGAQGDVGLVLQEFESTRFHRPDVVSCKVITGTSCTMIVGAYLPTYTLAHLPYLEETLARLQGQYPIILGDINMDLDEDQNMLSQLIAYLLMEFGFIDLMHHFRKHLLCHHLTTWTQVRQGTVSRARYDYILDTH